jgi:hypothetical protein
MPENGTEVVLTARWRRGTLLTKDNDNPKERWVTPDKRRSTNRKRVKCFVTLGHAHFCRTEVGQMKAYWPDGDVLH